MIGFLFLERLVGGALRISSLLPFFAAFSLKATYQTVFAQVVLCSIVFFNLLAPIIVAEEIATVLMTTIVLGCEVNTHD
jgi:hypothetical protein